MINFGVLRQPDPIENFKVNFTKVDIVCRNSQMFLELAGRATWSIVSVPIGTTFEYYELRVIRNVLIRSVS